MKIILSILTLLLLKGCSIPFMEKERLPVTPKNQAIAMIEKNIFYFLDYAKERKDEDIDFDLLVFKTKETSQSFAVLTIYTPYDMEQFVIYNKKYLWDLMDLLFEEIMWENYDFSWNLMVIRLEKQVDIDF